MRVADICTVNIAKDFVVRVGTAWGYCVTELSLISSFSRAFLSPLFCWVVVVICQRVCLGRNDAPWQNTHIKNWVGGRQRRPSSSSSLLLHPLLLLFGIITFPTRPLSLSLPTASRAILIDFCAFTMSPCARSGSAPPCCCCWQCLLPFLFSLTHTFIFFLFLGRTNNLRYVYKHFICRRLVMDSRINRPPWPTIRFSGSSPLEPNPEPFECKSFWFCFYLFLLFIL
jgi:hypothetical protein